MGTASTKKILKHTGSATLAEEAALLTSAGAGDADRIPALNAAGVLDLSITNGKHTSAGAADAGKLAALNAQGKLDATIVNSVTTSAGAGDAAKVVALDGTGKIDVTMMPVGIGADTQVITASEALVAGDWVNVYSSSGQKVRKADATVAGKECDGFVLAGVANGAAATVYFEGTNTMVTGMTAGAAVYLSTTAGLGTATCPSASGNVAQYIGKATSATSVNFQAARPITIG